MSWRLTRFSAATEGGFFRETFRDAGVIPGAALPAACTLCLPHVRSRAWKKCVVTTHRTPSCADASSARSFSTAIYFLIPAGSFSRLHRISSAECWHFYLGKPLTVVDIAPEDGTVTRTVLGHDLAAGQAVQHVVPGGRWFGCHPAREHDGAAAGERHADERSYSLVGCTVAPGFDFADFEMAKRSELLRLFPHAAADVTRLTDEQ